MNYQIADQILVSSQNFRETMEKRVFADEASLKSAIARAQGEIRKLELYRSRLGLEAQALQGGQALSEISALGRLIQKWNSQLAHLGVQETRARTYRWQEDKGKEETRRYAASVEVALAEGKEQRDAIKALREASEALENAFSLCRMIVGRAEAQQMPKTIPVGKIAATIANFERILGGLRDKLPEAEIRDATRKLTRIKQQQTEMGSVLARLGYSEEVSAYQARQEAEGIRYFRSNLPSVVREILSAGTVAELEKLASAGVNAAKKTILEAMKIAAKQNPERMKALLGQ